MFASLSDVNMATTTLKTVSHLKHFKHYDITASRVLQKTHILRAGRLYGTSEARKPITTTHYCLDIVKQNDYENFLSVLLLPQNARATAVAIRAFNVELAQVSDMTSETLMGKMRLQFWRDTLDQIYQGTAPKQPVALELQRAVEMHRLSKRWLRSLIDSREEQLDNKQFASIASVENYSEKCNSPLYYLILQGLVFNLWTKRTYGRARRGERVHRAVGGQRGRNTTVIAAIAEHCGILYHEIHYGSVTKEVFSDFIPSLAAIIGDARSIHVLDNAPIHNGIAAVYPELNFKFLPPYSPCLNPIENCFSVFKSYLKQYLHREAPRCNAAHARQEGVTLNALREKILQVGVESALPTVTEHVVSQNYNHVNTYLVQCIECRDNLQLIYSRSTVIEYNLLPYRLFLLKQFTTKTFYTLVGSFLPDRLIFVRQRRKASQRDADMTLLSPIPLPLSPSPTSIPHLPPSLPYSQAETTHQGVRGLYCELLRGSIMTPSY
ncbi:uncharacterized protein LOC121864144 isoform X2 [Homarus americanus]|uniref:uncharacterized protein LOC121864144 isoform X2 n=1 Tax=Homarus americanus TaxID=6706 RepID=UPI001C47911F|nr:uncharacterized protein LOC121864144 isoform X2 [Homarus americanus]